jgi:hypothetical protein
LVIFTDAVFILKLQLSLWITLINNFWDK